MKRPRNIVLIGISLVCLAVFICIVLMGSLWFFIALFPDASGQVRRIAYYESIASRVPFEIHEEIQGFKKVAYQDDERGKMLVGIPKISSQIAMASRLQKDAWNVNRIGLIIIAYKSHGGDTQEVVRRGSLSALRDVLGKTVIQRMPIRPIALFQELGQSDGGQPVSLYVERISTGIHGVISTHDTGFTAGKNKRMDQDISDADVSFISLQTDVLARISKRFNAIIQSEIAKGLGFKKTNPNIIGDLLSTGPLTIARKGDAVAIGVFSGGDAPAAIMNEWISHEQSVRHPQKRAFALPDKTIGYEYIPGKTNARFALNKGKNSCFPSEGYDENVFLCGQDKAVVFANEESLGEELISFLQAERVSWKGIIQGELLTSIGLDSDFHSLEYSGEDTVIEIWMDEKKPVAGDVKKDIPS